MGKIKAALAGVGNCASALIQGIQYYRKNPHKEDNLTTGLMHPKFGDYKVEDITFVAAFEVNRNKIIAPRKSVMSPTWALRSKPARS